MAKDIKRHLSHLKSSGGTAPSAADIVYGEIAVGYKANEEALYVKNSAGNVVTFTTAAGGQAIAEDYTDKRVITKVTGDSEISVSLSASGETSGRTLTITHAAGSEQSGFKKLSSDAYGHITGGTAVTLGDLTGLGALSGVTGEQGISASTRASGNQKIGHTNIITAGTAKTSTSSNVVVTPTSGSFTTPKVVYDANGHITSTGTDTINLRINSATTNTEGVVKLATATGTNNTNIVMTQKAVTDAINDSFAQQDAMVYKGLVGSGTNYGFPTTFSKGATYKVATAFTANSVSYEIGDMFIANTDVTTSENYTAAHWDAIQTNLDPTLYVNTATTVTGDGALESGGNLSTSRTITHKTLAPSGAAGTTSPSAAQTPNFNETFNVPVINYDKYGHITGVTTTTVKIPNSGSTWTYYTTGLTVTTATTSNTITLSGTNAAVKGTAILSGATQSAAGLMSKDDKTKLDGVATGAEVNQNAFSNVKVGSTTIAADGKTDTIEFAYGDAPVADAVKGLRIVPDATNDKATFQLGDIECGDYA